MGAKLLKFLRNNLLLVVPVLLAVGVLAEGAFQRGREEPTGTVETVNGVVSTPLVRFMDKYLLGLPERLRHAAFERRRFLAGACGGAADDRSFRRTGFGAYVS